MTLSNPAQYISGRTVQEQMNSLIDYVDQRAAEVATDAIASDVAQVHSDAADAHTDALAAAASASAAAGTLANAVKKTGEASQSIAGDIAVSGSLDAASIGSGSTPIVCGDLTAFGNVSLDDTTLQGNLASADSSALINLSGAGSVLVPTPTSNGEAATKKYVDDADALKLNITDINNYAVGLTGNQAPIAGNKGFTGSIEASGGANSQKFVVKATNIDKDIAPGSTLNSPIIAFTDMNGNWLTYLFIRQKIDRTIDVRLWIRNTDGTQTNIELGAGS